MFIARLLNKSDEKTTYVDVIISIGENQQPLEEFKQLFLLAKRLCSSITVWTLDVREGLNSYVRFSIGC